MTDKDRLRNYIKELSNFLDSQIPNLNKAKARRMTIQIIEEQRRINRLINEIKQQQ